VRPQTQISKRLAKPQAQSGGGQAPLTVQDHTAVIKAVIENFKPLTKKLGKKRPSGVEVLNALLQVRGVDARTKASIRNALAVLPMIEKARKKMPAATKAAVNEVNQQLENARTMPEMIKNLKAVKKSRTASKKSLAAAQAAPDNGILTGVDLAISILEDGRSTIYSPEMLQTISGTSGVTQAAKQPAKNTVGTEDAKGAVAGGVTGCLYGAAGGTIVLPGGGTAAGCVGVGVVAGTATAIGASAAAIFAMFL
jgi:hypothetical protein